MRSTSRGTFGFWLQFDASVLNKLVGNGMHLTAVGAMLLFALAITSVEEQEQQARLARHSWLHRRRGLVALRRRDLGLLLQSAAHQLDTAPLVVLNLKPSCAARCGLARAAPCAQRPRAHHSRYPTQLFLFLRCLQSSAARR